MEVRFRNAKLDRLEVDASYDGGYSQAVVRSYRKLLQIIRAADDERVFRALKSLHFEKLRGNRSHQWSMRLNDQWRLILEMERSSRGRVIVVIAIEDYH
jgi:toxin HigB-1